jgi:hypothetical protein
MAGENLFRIFRLPDSLGSIVSRESIDNLSTSGDRLALKERPVDRQRRIVMIVSTDG